jgi:hypothetical protein
MRNHVLAFSLFARYTWDKANRVLMMFRLYASWIYFLNRQRSSVLIFNYRFLITERAKETL